MFKIPPSSALSTRNQQIVPCIINGKFLRWMLSLNFEITTDFSVTYTTAKLFTFSLGKVFFICQDYLVLELLINN